MVRRPLRLLELTAGVAIVAAVSACIDTSGFATGKKDAGITCAASEVFTNGQCAPRVAKCTDPGAPVCEHGTCEDTGGVAVCTCEEGYTSALCSACVAGSQDNDKDGTCTPDCATAALTCPTHGKCDDTKGTAACACAPGYVLEAAACVWRGGPLDPAFQKKPDTWRVEGGAVIDPVATGGINPGVARFDKAAMCGAGGVRQTFVMPSGPDSEAFALKLSSRLACESCANDGIGVLTNKGFTRMPVTAGAAFTSQRICLGERAYGGPLDLLLQGISANSGCDEAAPVLEIDNASIEPAADCPIPGQIPNADYEGTGSWATSGLGAEVATNVGTAGSRAGHIFTTMLCQGPSLAGTMSAPYTSVPNPALSFTYKGTNGKDMAVTANGNIVVTAMGTATFQSASMCLPEWSKGTVMPLVFGLPSTTGLCSTADVRDFVFDDLKFVSDPSCPSPAYVIDGGFEKESGVSRSWHLKSPPGFGSSASITTEPVEAHGGSGALEMSVSQPCLTATASQVITVPDSLGAAGPAAKFWYKAPKVTNASFRTTPGGTMIAAANYTERTVCLDPKKSGRAFTFVITSDGGSGTCADSYGRETLWVDDVQVTTDPACPTK